LELRFKLEIVHVHAHKHHHVPTASVLRWSVAATAIFVVIEAAAGVHAQSLALLSDAAHNFTDTLALVLAWVANYLETKPADEIKTYGYQRAGVLSAFVNALTLAALAAWILYESVLRLRNPVPVNQNVMIAVAALGVALNGGILWALRAARHRDLNVRSAFMHMLGDALGSLAIIGGGIVIYYTGWVQIDPVLSIAIAVLIVWTAWDIIRESLNILLEGLPRGLKLKDVVGSMRAIEGVLDVHDVHIWSLGSSTHALSCHVLIEDVPPSASDAVLRRLNGMLAERFYIAHTTVQFEHASCAVSENGCVIPAHMEHHHHDH
jgi:cobalt-zinc-cadmium efflux system protein